jgi:hypothetical protein
LSPLIEVATLLAVSLVTDAIAIALFAAVRGALPHATPNPEKLLTQPASYAYNQIGYLAVWALALLAVSCAVAVLIGRFASSLGVPTFLTPLVVDASAWYEVFESGPKGYGVYVACDLQDGAYLGGMLDWYSTELQETADRDFALAAPFEFAKDGEMSDLAGFDRVVVSARQLTRMYVAFVEPGGDSGHREQAPLP